MKLTYDNPDNLQEDSSPILEDSKKGLIIPVHTDVGLQQSVPVSINIPKVPKETSEN